MKIAELFESTLEDLPEILLLMKHGKLDRAQATELASKLKAFDFYVDHGRRVVALRWVEDKGTNALKFISAGMPGSWRSGAAAMSRFNVKKLLGDYGFKVAGFQSDAAKRLHTPGNAPHIFFWGKGTPDVDPKKLEKIWGTDEYVAARTAATAEKLKAHQSKQVKESINPANSSKDELGDLADALRFRTTSSHITMEQAKDAWAWFQKSGYRFHERVLAGTQTKYFKIVNMSFKNKDYRTKNGYAERIDLEKKLRTFGFKVGRGPGHVRDNKDFTEYGWTQSGRVKDIVFW